MCTVPSMSVQEKASGMKSDVMICKSCVFPTDLDAHALLYFFSIWSASRKIRTLKSTSACTRRRRCISNAFSSSLRKITNLKRKLAGTSFVILLLETCFSSTVFCCSPSISLTHQVLFVYYVFVSLLRTSNLITSLKNQIQSLRDGLSEANEKENALNKTLESRNEELQEKLRTITQVKKIGRRYKTQYDELKVDHDKVSQSAVTFFCSAEASRVVLFETVVPALLSCVLLIWYIVFTFFPIGLIRWLLRQQQVHHKTRRLAKRQSRSCRVSKNP